MKTKFQNILFDLDGTLINPYEGITKSIRYALEKMEVPVPDQLNWCIGPPLQDSARRLLKGYPDKKAKDVVSLYRERFSKVGMYENEIYDGIIELLTSASNAGHNLYVATSKLWIYAEKIVDHFKMLSFFKKVYGSELDGTRSNKADLIQYILQNENIQLEDAMMVGDTKYDLIGAKANGIACVGVTWGYGELGELEAEKPNKICTKPSDLIAYLQTS